MYVGCMMGIWGYLWMYNGYIWGICGCTKGIFG